MNHHITYRIILILVLLAGLLPDATDAQHSHGVLTPSVTFPPDDSVLLQPPELLTMSFRVPVSLLKLALYNDQGDWINIDFRYMPGSAEKSFVYPLPTLPETAYYLVQWSVVDDQQRFLSGEFRFTFGAEAIPPSEYIEAGYRDPSEESLPSTGNYARSRDR